MVGAMTSQFGVMVSDRGGVVTVPPTGSDGLEEGSSMRCCHCGVLVAGVPPDAPGMLGVGIVFSFRLEYCRGSWW